MGTTRISSKQNGPATTFSLEADVYQVDTANRRWQLRFYLKCVNGPGANSSSSYSGWGEQRGMHGSGDTLFRSHNGNNFLPSGYGDGSTRWHEGPYYAYVNANGNGYWSGSSTTYPLQMNLTYGSIDVDLTGSISLSRMAITPPAPDALSVTEATEDSLVYRFASNGTGGGTFTRWEAQYSTSPNFSSGNGPVTSTTGTYTATNLDPRTTYYFRGRGVNSVGNGSWTSQILRGTTTDLADAPPKPTIQSTTATSITVYPDDPSYLGPTPHDRTLQISTSSTFATVLSSVVDPVRPYTFSGLTRGSRYYFRQNIKNAVGAGPWSPISTSTTLIVPPSAPTGYSAYDISSESARINGGAISDNGGQSPSNQRVQFNTSATDVGATVTTSGYWGSTDLTGLVKGTVYHYRVAAYNGSGWGSYGAWATFTTKSNTPGPPANLAASSITGTTALLTWDTPAALNGSSLLSVNVKISPTASFGTDVQTFSLAATETSQALGSLASNTKYYAQVWSTSNNGLGSASVIISFTTTGGSGTTPAEWYNDNGVFRKVSRVWYNDGGVWKPVLVSWYNDNGIWRTG